MSPYIILLKASAVVRVAFLNDWAIKSFGSHHYNRGIEASSSATCVDLLKDKNQSKQQEIPSSTGILSDLSDSEERKSKKYWKNFHSENKNSQKEKKLNQDDYLLIKIQNEVSLFRNLIVSEQMPDEDCISTRRFWLKHQSQLPNLFKLLRKLLNIQASTAFVERFFSIFRIICSDKNANMNDNTIIMRSVLKSNIETLNELIIEEED